MHQLTQRLLCLADLVAEQVSQADQDAAKAFLERKTHRGDKAYSDGRTLYVIGPEGWYYPLARWTGQEVFLQRRDTPDCAVQLHDYVSNLYPKIVTLQPNW